jgi:ubiquinone/menaquinone biosynthesis C-methylase UbiE
MMRKPEEEAMLEPSTLDRNNPHHPDNEPPKKSLAVNLVMKFAQSINRAAFVTPHLFGGSNLSKVEYEYDFGNTFLDIVKEYANLSIFDNKDVLDVGCGWGGKMIYYAEHTKLKTITGFDLPGYLPESSAEFALKKNARNCFFETGYAEKMAYEEEQFDLIIMEDVLEHVAEPEKVLSECYRVLKPKGIIFAKFPSFKSMHAHHLDRAISLPALHYILPMKTWAAGFNYLLLDKDKFNYTPFRKIVSTKYNDSVTSDLNGLDFESFSDLVKESQFKTKLLKLVPGKVNQGKRKLIKPFYNTAYKTSIFREFLSSYILFIGEKTG